MLPLINKSLVVLFSGLILSFLEMDGLVSAQNHTENEQVIQTVVGGIIGAITIGSYFLHHTAIEKAKIQSGIVEQKNPSGLSELFVVVRDFVFARNKSAPAPTAPVEVLP